MTLAECRPLTSCDEPLEARVPAQRREVRIDLEPARREIVRDLEQRLEPIEGCIFLSHEQVDLDARDSVKVQEADADRLSRRFLSYETRFPTLQQ